MWHRIAVRTATLACALLFASGGACDSPAATPEPLFSMVVISDPHISGDAEREARLASVVAAINDEVALRDIELVLVLGDIGWNDQLPTAKAVLDQLTVPYVPIIGDNEVHDGVEELYDSVFSPQLDLLASSMEGFARAPTPTANPETSANSWLQNFTFSHRGVHFVAADWCARGIEGLEGELAYLHDFAGGSWPWFEATMTGLADAEPSSVIMLSHIPMHEGAFHADGLATIEALIASQADAVSANFAGHVHHTYDYDAGLYDVFITTATWTSYEPGRIVEVSTSAGGLLYEQELLYVPF